jgi:hypothetical protein
MAFSGKAIALNLENSHPRGHKLAINALQPEVELPRAPPHFGGFAVQRTWNDFALPAAPFVEQLERRRTSDLLGGGRNVWFFHRTDWRGSNR